MANTIANVLTGVCNVEVRYPVGGVYVDAGYTLHGVDLEYNAETADVDVEEETFSIDRVITKEEISVIFEMAEASLVNLNWAMAGGVLAGDVITLDAGAIKEYSIRLTGTDPGGGNRVVTILLATATGQVRLPFKKGEPSAFQVTFKGLKGAGNVCTIDDS